MTELCEWWRSLCKDFMAGWKAGEGLLEWACVGCMGCWLHVLSFEMENIVWRRPGRDPGGSFARKNHIEQPHHLAPSLQHPFPERRPGRDPRGSCPKLQTPNSKPPTPTPTLKPLNP